MIYLLAQGFWFMLPAMYSNMAPVWAKRLPFLDRFNKPLDHNKKLRGRPLFGPNKTYRGFVAGLLFALTVSLAQWLLSESFAVIDRLEFVALSGSDYILLGVLMGFGALAGDAIESLLKRQLEIPSGEAWVPLDQLDYVLGAFLFALPVVSLELGQYAAAGFVGIFLHPIATIIGWKLGLKDKPI